MSLNLDLHVNWFILYAETLEQQVSIKNKTSLKRFTFIFKWIVFRFFSGTKSFLSLANHIWGERMIEKNKSSMLREGNGSRRKSESITKNFTHTLTHRHKNVSKHQAFSASTILTKSSWIAVDDVIICMFRRLKNAMWFTFTGKSAKKKRFTLKSKPKTSLVKCRILQLFNNIISTVSNENIL